MHHRIANRPWRPRGDRRHPPCCDRCSRGGSFPGRPRQCHPAPGGARHPSRRSGHPESRGAAQRPEHLPRQRSAGLAGRAPGDRRCARGGDGPGSEPAPDAARLAARPARQRRRRHDFRGATTCRGRRARHARRRLRSRVGASRLPQRCGRAGPRQGAGGGSRSLGVARGRGLRAGRPMPDAPTRRGHRGRGVRSGRRRRGRRDRGGGHRRRRIGRRWCPRGPRSRSGVARGAGGIAGRCAA